MFFRKIFIIKIALFAIFYGSVVYANPKGTVNILTRYLYLRSPKAERMIQDSCGVKISYDEYHSGSECRRRSINLHHYDLIIVPDNIYHVINKRLLKVDTDLYKVSKEYDAWVKNYYLLRKYPGNVVFFLISFTGVIWNPNIVNISDQDNIKQMFKKAGSNVVVLSDSRTGMRYLIDNEQKLPISFMHENFKETIAGANVYITNGYNKLYGQDNFAFAFQYLGDAIDIIKTSKNKKLKYMVHPRYSYISPDLLIQLNNRIETKCVAKVLASKKFLDIIQSDGNYLSPYRVSNEIKDSVFQGIYRDFLKSLSGIKWLDSFLIKNAKKYDELRNAWAKIHALPVIQKTHGLVLNHTDSAK